MAEAPRHPESRDVWPKALLSFGAGLLAFLALALAILHFLFGARPGWPPENAAAVQSSPDEDLASIRREEDAALGRLAWVDREAGIARIPVEEAMKLVARGGLPHWPRPPASGEARP